MKFAYIILLCIDNNPSDQVPLLSCDHVCSVAGGAHILISVRLQDVNFAARKALVNGGLQKGKYIILCLQASAKVIMYLVHSCAFRIVGKEAACAAPQEAKMSLLLSPTKLKATHQTGCP
jgi:hypothetical protein